ncbi:FHA domain-containing protein [Defluviimonas sp. WL0024]|uniref:FHA domain-containing protein n=2 Tax=Albidovulum TaxID=205889 RepID=A0ABT3J3W8_9RHOB|nr:MULTISPECIES: FHA domain-containing protein [Defluviimonas]MCU9847897.1 FHA domain-containing protein [Defluviimonas sp. WL0024]MCW3782390.1 FHA domain-containing protein [Defluviimonas salinarum]
MKIRPLQGLGDRGFSFDLVSRRKAMQERAAEPAPEPAPASEPEPAPVVAAETPKPAASNTGQVEAFETLILRRLSSAMQTAETAPQPVAAPVKASEVRPAAEVAPISTPAPVAPSAPTADPAPAAAAVDSEQGSAPRRSSRVKTTFLGFDRSGGRVAELFAEGAASAPVTGRSEFPFGWVVVVKGPGRGASFTLQAGVSQIGRGDDQAIQLDFGDTNISRANHAAIAFDDEERKFYLGHGGKANIVRLNGKPVLSTEHLQDGDLIRIGETTLSFVAFCDEDFTWADQ